MLKKRLKSVGESAKLCSVKKREKVGFYFLFEGRKAKFSFKSNPRMWSISLRTSNSEMNEKLGQKLAHTGSMLAFLCWMFFI